MISCRIQHDLYYTLGIDFRYKLYHATKNVNLKRVFYRVTLESLLISLFLLIILAIHGSSNEKISVYPIYAQNIDTDPIVGMNMRGYYTSMPQERNFSFSIPANYYQDSFEALSNADIKFIRYLFFWESYVRNPSPFMAELQTVADVADKLGIKVLYANDQFDTSSWLGPKTATGFPSFLFENNPAYPYGTGGGTGPKDHTAKKWWDDWIDRKIKDQDGNDGWALQVEFLKQIVNMVDDHNSTLGYEILNEPHVNDISQWVKIGRYNTFMVDELRGLTQKPIFFDRQVPSELDGPIGANPENMAKMAPANKENVIFKATIFGLPSNGSYAEARLHYYAKAAEIAGVPLCICEFNLRSYGESVAGEDTNVTFSQQNVDLIVNKIKEVGVWGMGAWLWNIKEHSNPNYDFVNFDDEGIRTTENFKILESAYKSIENLNIRDTISPALHIDTPEISTDGTTLLLRGYSFDLGSGLKSVEVHTNDGEYQPVTPIKHNDWSHWEATLPLYDDSKTIIGLAIDNAGNKEYRTLQLTGE